MADSLVELTDLADAAYQRGHDDKAIALYREAAERGSARAQFSLGKLYSFGLGTAQDTEEGD